MLYRFREQSNETRIHTYLHACIEIPIYICYTYTAFDMKSNMQLSRCVDRWYIYIHTRKP